MSSFCAQPTRLLTPSAKNIILQLFRRAKIIEPEIEFDLIGKKSRAHQIAIEVFQGKRRPDIIVKAQDILAIFYK